MLVIAPTALLSHAGHPSDPGRLERLAIERAHFEDVLQSDDRGPAHDRIVAVPMGQGVNVLYPCGVSSRRFAHSFGFPGEEQLMFQSMHGKVARTDWYVTLLPAKGAPPKRGTLRRLFWRDGLRIDDRRLTQSQRALLDADVLYAGYGTVPIVELLRTWVIPPDGSYRGQFSLERDGKEGPVSEPVFRGRSFFPILPEESAALGLGKGGWLGDGKYWIRPIGN